MKETFFSLCCLNFLTEIPLFTKRTRIDRSVKYEHQAASIVLDYNRLILAVLALDRCKFQTVPKLDLNSKQEAGDNEMGRARGNSLHVTIASIITQICMQVHQGSASRGALLYSNKRQGRGLGLTHENTYFL
jgi:hypothetical protein